MAEVTKVKDGEAQGGISAAVPAPVAKLADYPRRFRQFLHDVRVEMRQVTWPTRADVRATTAVVVVTVFFFGFFLFGVDFGVSHVVEWVIRTFKP